MSLATLPPTGLVILVIGQGGREHALVEKLAASPRVRKVFCAPGNAGTSALAENVPIDPLDFDALAAFAVDVGVDLAVVGPADPVAAGLVDHFEARGLRIFGPTRAQAVLESSKVFSKAFMRRHGIPTARYATFTDATRALAYLDEVWTPDGLVVKVDGLADVTSTLVTTDLAEARAEIVRALVERRYGRAGEQVVIEERLVGPEVSLLAFVDGQTWRLLPPAQDHKPLLDGGQGPNTEGMGAYAPAPLVDDALLARLARDVLEPSCRGLAAEGLGFAGILFVGVLVTADGPKVLEYNCRFGDPETQVALAGLQTDLVDVIEACLAGRLADVPLAFDGRAYVCVTATDPAYPTGYAPGTAVTGLEQAAAVEGVRLLHALTRETPVGPVVNGGRVVNVLASGRDLAGAREAAYEAIAHVRLGAVAPHYRRDIAAPSALSLVERGLESRLEQPAPRARREAALEA